MSVRSILSLPLLSTYAAAALAACGSVPNETRDAAPDGHAADPDAMPDTPTDPVTCNPGAPFGAPVALAGLSAGNWNTARLSRDELTLYTSGAKSGGTQNDLFRATRASRDAAFDELVPLRTSSMTGSDNFPSVSGDGLTIVFDSERDAGRRLYIAQRTVGAAEFPDAAMIAGVAGPGGGDTDSDPFLTDGGEELWFSSNRQGTLGNIDLYRAVKVGAGFGAPEHVLALSSTESDGIPVLSADRLTIYFQSARGGTGTSGGFDIWTSHRSTSNDGFPPPRPVTELNSAGVDWPGWLSADGCRLYLASSREGDMKLYLAERQPGTGQP